jgi:hypothetical protein
MSDEIQSLNLSDLDVETLEQRLELGPLFISSCFDNLCSGFSNGNCGVNRCEGFN